MKPGRELDALVAEKVMGCKVYCVDPNYSYKDPPKMWRCDCPGPNSAGERPHADDYSFDGEIKSYSTDIAAAWQVVEHLKSGYGWNVTASGGGYKVILWRGGGGACQITGGETAAHAICLAALKALYKEFEYNRRRRHMEQKLKGTLKVHLYPLVPGSIVVEGKMFFIDSDTLKNEAPFEYNIPTKTLVVHTVENIKDFAAAGDLKSAIHLFASAYNFEKVELHGIEYHASR